MREIKSYEDALALYQSISDDRSIKFSDALEAFMPFAEVGNAKAQYMVGDILNCHLHHYDPESPDFVPTIEQVNHDQGEAIKWLTLSAAQDHGWASNDLGILYAEKYFGPLDWPEIELLARPFILRACELQMIAFYPSYDADEYLKHAKVRFLERKARMDHFWHRENKDQS